MLLLAPAEIRGETCPVGTIFEGCELYGLDSLGCSNVVNCDFRDAACHFLISDATACIQSRKYDADWTRYMSDLGGEFGITKTFSPPATVPEPPVQSAGPSCCIY